MKVILAGFNIEAGMIKKAESALGVELTPEVISAAYARISRDPRNVDILRKEAGKEVGKARKSNETIVFDMGHSSIAEHAVFNFDVMDVSRIAVEAVEHFRLASFTEKSQRYIRLGKDFITPDEITGAGYGSEFLRLVEMLNRSYETVYSKIVASGADQGIAKEDARYLMPLATSAQFGMTLNARELEYMASRLACHPLKEVREFSAGLTKIAHKTTPSLVRYPEATGYLKSLNYVREKAGKLPSGRGKNESSRVSLIEATENGDLKLAAGIIFSGGGVPYRKALKTASRLGSRKRAELILDTMREMESHDRVLREFENLHMLFELVVSATCYAQLKRHRMSTQIVQRYSVSLGVSIPESVVNAKAVGIFRKAIAESERLYRKLTKKAGMSADYVLTNAHRRRVLLNINLRELYHFSRLRSDRHAQWEIREISDLLCRSAAVVFPAGSLLLGGKDIFLERKKGINA